MKTTTLEPLEKLIAEHPFWKGSKPDLMRFLKPAAVLQRFGVGQTVFQQGQDADHFFLVLHGHVALERFVPGKGMVTIQTVGSGEALGWSWLFAPYIWHLTARSTDATEAIAFGARALRDKAAQDHEFGYDLAMRVGRIMWRRLGAMTDQLLDFYASCE